MFSAISLSIAYSLLDATPPQYCSRPLIRSRSTEGPFIKSLTPELKCRNGYDDQDLIFRMDQASGDHPSADWTGQFERWLCTDTSMKALQRLPRVHELTLRFARSCCNCHYSAQGLSCPFRRISELFLRTCFATTDHCL